MAQAMSGDNSEVVRLEAAQAQMRQRFLGWQCRLRQLAVRQADGRPTSGMRPSVGLEPAGESLGEITVLIVKSEPEEVTAQFRHLVRKTHDPAERLQGALKHLQAAYYQRPLEFADEMTALFGPDSALAERLVAAGACRLDFEQYRQRYRIPCSVRDLPEADRAFQATYWHNSLFNPNLPAGVRVLGFKPHWSHAEAEPEVG